MLKLLLICSVVALALGSQNRLGDAVAHQQCKNGDKYFPTVLSFDVPECSGTPACHVVPGQRVTLLIGLNVTSAVSSMPVQGRINANGVEVPLTLPYTDACQAIPTGCPSKAGDYMTTFDTNLNVDSPMVAKLNMMFKNQDGDVIGCLDADINFSN